MSADDIQMLMPYTHVKNALMENIDASCSIAVTADPANNAERLQTAREFADELSLPFIEQPENNYDIFLTVCPDRLELRVRQGRRCVPLRLDWSGVDTFSSAGVTRRQPIAKAVGIGKSPGGPPTVIDATAGFGGDTWLLASLGCRVTAIERSPIIAALLRDTHQRAGVLNEPAVQRIITVCADAHQWLPTLSIPPDVIYLDPMFPPKKKSALERQTMRTLRRIVGADEDAVELFDIAIEIAARRVVVKRPLHADPIAKRVPTVTHKGKSMRYDVYVVTSW